MKKIYLPILTFIFVLCSTSEIQAQSLDNTTDQQEVLSIYPNPASGNILNISSKSGKSITCRVFNVLGKTVLFKVMTSEQLDISTLRSGVYVLRIKVGEEEFTKKFIKN